MCIHARSLIAAAILAVSPACAFAQDNIVPPRALTPLTFDDTDYPASAMFMSEHGTVGLELTIGMDGRVASARVANSSGFLALDAAAEVLAKSRWRFEPALQNGQPVESSLRVETIWNLPLLPADDLLLIPRPSPEIFARSDEIVQPVRIDRGLVTERDYPTISINRRESGRAELFVVIGVDGRVSNVVLRGTSGYPRLDEAALTYAKRQFRYKPAELDGVPVPWYTEASVSFCVDGGCGQRLTTLLCSAHPIIIGYHRYKANQPPQRWALLDKNGEVAEALILTRSGWMRFAPSIVAQIRAAAANRPRSSQVDRPDVCWVPF